MRALRDRACGSHLIVCPRYGSSANLVLSTGNGVNGYTLDAALGEFILTHAPLAPWFSSSKYPAGGYTKVHAEVGDLIDWYNLQYYMAPKFRVAIW